MQWLAAAKRDTLAAEVGIAAAAPFLDAEGCIAAVVGIVVEDTAVVVDIAAVEQRQAAAALEWVVPVLGLILPP